MMGNRGTLDTGLSSSPVVQRFSIAHQNSSSARGIRFVPLLLIGEGQTTDKQMKELFNRRQQIGERKPPGCPAPERSSLVRSKPSRWHEANGSDRWTARDTDSGLAESECLSMLCKEGRMHDKEERRQAKAKLG
jgi:hypothetical protein